MTIAYPLRLLCLCLAAFFLVHLAVGLAVASIAPAAIRIADKMRPRRAAGWLLALRLLPAGLALFLVAGFCVPSYLWLEPAGTAEEVGVWFVAAVLASAAIWGISTARVGRATIRSQRYVRNCQRVGLRTRLAGESGPVWVIDGAAPSFALAGIVRTRMVVSREVVSALSADQMAAALRHERAHRISRDNLKRLFILAAPDVFPFCRAFGTLEREWARFTEWAADDRAVAGNARRSLSLAAALVRVARLGEAARPSPLAMTFLSGNEDLSARVERLLSGTRPRERRGRSGRIRAAGAVLALAVVAVVLLQPATVHSVHGLLERLIH